MKVILIKDVRGMGRMFDEITTADGHALNFLIPQGFAVMATPAAARDAERRRKQFITRGELDAVLLNENIAALATARIVIKMKANEKGHLYDAVGIAEIAQAAKEQAGIDLPESAIKLEKPIKEIGTFTIPVATADTFGEFSIIVEAE